MSSCDLDSYKELVRDANRIEKIAGGYTQLKLERNGTLVGLCPMHEEKTPSFKVDPKKQRFRCFGCSAGGDVFKLVELVENICFKHALDHLAKRAGIEKSKRAHSAVKPVKALRSSSEAGSPETGDVALIGLSVENLAEIKHLSSDNLKGWGCSNVRYSKKPAVKMLYRDHDGKTIGTRFRISLNGDRFRWRLGDKTQLYGLDRLSQIQDRGWCVIVEGESDCWTGWHHGLPVIGVPGKSVWQRDWQKHFEGLSVFLWQEPGAADMADKIGADISKLKVMTAPGDAKDLSAAHIKGDDIPALVEDLKSKARPYREILAERNAEITEQAREVLDSPDPLEIVKTAITDSGYGGDVQVPLLSYIAATSRVLTMRSGAMPVHLLLHGQASSGKSYALTTIFRLLPESAVHKIDASSPRTLIYDRAELKHRVLVYSEADSLPAGEDNPAASAVRNLLQEHELNYDATVRDPEKGGFTVMQIRKEGPTVLFTTATRRLGHQLESRLFVVDVPDSQKQIQMALKAQAALELNGAKAPPAGLVEFQELLQVCAPWDVFIPFVEQLAEEIGRSPAASRILRDFARIVSMIKAVTVIRHQQRTRDAQGRLVAEIADYQTVYELVKDIYSASVSGASQGVREVVEAVKQLKADKITQVRNVDVAKKLGQSDMSVSRNVRAAKKGGWLVNEEARAGLPANLVLGNDLPADAGLPHPSALSHNTATKTDFDDSTSDQPGNAITSDTGGD